MGGAGLGLYGGRRGIGQLFPGGTPSGAAEGSAGLLARLGTTGATLADSSVAGAASMPDCGQRPGRAACGATAGAGCAGAADSGATTGAGAVQPTLRPLPLADAAQPRAPGSRQARRRQRRVRPSGRGAAGASSAVCGPASPFSASMAGHDEAGVFVGRQRQLATAVHGDGIEQLDGVRMQGLRQPRDIGGQRVFRRRHAGHALLDRHARAAPPGPPARRHRTGHGWPVRRPRPARPWRRRWPARPAAAPDDAGRSCPTCRARLLRSGCRRCRR